MASGSEKVVIAALIGNGLITITKFFASIFTGSSAMLSEAIHSLTDTVNQGLIMLGLKRSKKPADEKHPFGYAKEIYFWSFVVAILIFSIGAGVAIYEGIHKIMHPEPITNAWVNYLVLGLAMVFETFAWWVAFKEFKKEKGQLSYLQAVRQSKRVAVFTVLLEDTAALLGLVIAFVGLAISQATGIAEIDGVTSVVIGILLAAVAILLSQETKALLIGEGASSETKLKIKDIVNNHDEVEGINEILTMHLGPEDILLNLSVDFKNSINAQQVEEVIAKISSNIKQDIPEVKRVFIEAKG